MTVSKLPATLETFSGDLIRPDDPGYDDARRLYNGLIDRRPALIARCRGTADVVAALAFARDEGLEISVRGGGHGVAGKAVLDDGLVVDLSQLRGIHVDPAARTARVQPGVSWAELNRETQLHGLAVTGGVISTTGIAGLTLGGGLGWMMGKYGLATDNVLSLQLVTADGEIVTASEKEHEDLFWALRGGGGNFGVVTWFEYRLHPVGPMVTGGIVAHPFEAAGDVLRFFREFTGDLPDEAAVFAGVAHAPDGSGAKIAVLVACHVGEPDAAEECLRPLREFGSPILTELGPLPYTAMNAILDGGYPPGSLNYWKSAFLEGLTDDAVDTIIERFSSCPSPATAILLEHFHGAVTRVPVDATAVPHREPGYNLVITSVWSEPSESDANIAWTRETFAAADRFTQSRRYINYLSEDDGGPETVQAAFGLNGARLAEVKRKYDPANVFHSTLNVEPARGA